MYLNGKDDLTERKKRRVNFKELFNRIKIFRRTRLYVDSKPSTLDVIGIKNDHVGATRTQKERVGSDVPHLLSITLLVVSVCNRRVIIIVNML